MNPWHLLVSLLSVFTLLLGNMGFYAKQEEKTRFIAHRGFCSQYLENTEEAFIKAAEVGFDGCETDVNISKDGVLMLVHGSEYFYEDGTSMNVNDYTYEELTAVRNPSWDKALSHIDVLIDGPYIETQRSFRRPLVGSDNQRFHFLTNRYRMDDFRRNTIEVRISPDGTARLNGMGDLRALEQRFLKTTTRKHQQQ